MKRARKDLDHQRSSKMRGQSYSFRVSRSPLANAIRQVSGEQQLSGGILFSRLGPVRPGSCEDLKFFFL